MRTTHAGSAAHIEMQKQLLKDEKQIDRYDVKHQTHKNEQPTLRTRDNQVIEKIDYNNREVWVQAGFNAFGIFGAPKFVDTGLPGDITTGLPN